MSESVSEQNIIKVDNSPTHPPRCYLRFNDNNCHCVEFRNGVWYVDDEKQESNISKVIFTDVCDFGEIKEWSGTKDE